MEAAPVRAFTIKTNFSLAYGRSTARIWRFRRCRETARRATFLEITTATPPLEDSPYDIEK